MWNALSLCAFIQQQGEHMSESSRATSSPEGTASAGDQQFLAFLYRHLVGICWVTRAVGFDGEERGNPDALCATAVAVESNGHWYLVTAGHIVKLIEQQARDASLRITGATLFNAWAQPGRLTQCPLPIDLYQMKSCWKYDRGEGIDFGMMLLGGEHVRVLRSRGTVPFLVHQIGVPSGRDVEQYWLLGLPEELQETVPATSAAGCSLDLEPNVFRVFTRDNPGCFFDTDRPRFFADVPAQVLLNDMNGMSGGPLFAFTRGETAMEGCVAGLQSGWNSELRVIVASPASVFLEELRRGESQILAAARPSPAVS